MIKDDGTVIHFNNPKVGSFYVLFRSSIIFLQVQASLAANTFAVTGHAENKRKFIMIGGMDVFLYSMFQRLLKCCLASSTNLEPRVLLT